MTSATPSPERTPNSKLRAAREALGASGASRVSRATLVRNLQDQAREMGVHDVGFDVTKVQRWEEQGMRPRDEALDVLAEYFASHGYTLADIGLAPAPTPMGTPASAGSTVVNGSQQTHGQGDRVDRRHFVAAVPAVLATASVDIQRHRRVGMGDVARLRAAMSRLAAIDDDIGGENLHPVAAQYLKHAQMLLEQSYAPAVGQALRTTATELATDAGWYAYDAGHTAVAHSYLTQALYLARLADDLLLEAQVYSLMSLTANATRRSREALDLARVGQRVVVGAPPALRALFDARAALASALLGERTSWRTAMTSAWKNLEADDGGAPAWAAFFNPAELRTLETICDVDLGAERRAARSLEQVIKQPDEYERNRALRAANLAGVRLTLGELDGACEAARLVMSRPIGSARVRGQLSNVMARMGQHLDTPCAAQTVDMWRHLTGASHG